jgi:hypothetical protein
MSLQHVRGGPTIDQMVQPFGLSLGPARQIAVSYNF